MAPPPPAPPPNDDGRGPTTALIIGGIVVVLLIVLGALAVAGIDKFRLSAKRAEATHSLGRMAKLAAAAYDRDQKVCPSATAPVPGDETLVSGKRYESTGADWNPDRAQRNGVAGFACLGFSMDAAQLYQYRYDAASASYAAVARGDLDGDGIFSRFELIGHVSQGRLVPAPQIAEIDPTE